MSTSAAVVPMAFSSAPYVAMAQAAGRDVRYWQVRNAQHFDAFLGFPQYGAVYLPLLPYVYSALDRVDAYLDGKATLPVDAMIATVQPPQEPIARALRGGARLLEITGPEVDRLREHYPLLRRTLLPRGTYPGQDAPLHTVGVDLLLVCRADLDTETVYELTRARFEDMPAAVR